MIQTYPKFDRVAHRRAQRDAQIAAECAIVAEERAERDAEDDARWKAMGGDAGFATFMAAEVAEFDAREADKARWNA